MSNIINHARREFKALGYIPPEEDQEEGPNKWIQENVLELLKVFSDQGHSGASSPYCVNMFKKLALFKPLGPLTGEDDEWNKGSLPTDDGPYFQNNRCSHVFKDNTGTYDSQGRIFVEPDRCAFTSYESRVPVTFPYTPQSEYVYIKFERGRVAEKLKSLFNELSNEQAKVPQDTEEIEYLKKQICEWDGYAFDESLSETEEEEKEREARGERFTVIRTEVKRD